ncbi:MAG: hypothetical protein ACXIVQ_11625 [Acidimicrobiales bacterium]
MGADRDMSTDQSSPSTSALRFPDLRDLDAVAPSTGAADLTVGATSRRRHQADAEWVEDHDITRVTRLTYGLHLTVLLVCADDAEPFRQAAEESVLDMHIDSVPTAEATLARLERSGSGLRRRPLPDAIVLALPIADSHTLLATIRSDHRYAEVPLIVLTGTSSPELERRSFKLGAVAHLPIPRRDYERVALVHALPDFMPRVRARHAQLESHRR